MHVPYVTGVSHRGGLPAPAAAGCVPPGLDRDRIARIAGDLARRLHEDRAVAPMFARGLQTEAGLLDGFLASWLLGHPDERFGEAPRSLRTAHAELPITPTFANRWVGHFIAAVRAVGIPDEQAAGLVAAARTIAHGLVNRESPPDPGEKLRCVRPAWWNEIDRAGRAGDVRTFRRLLDDSPHAADKTNGPVLLARAAGRGRTEVVEDLISRGVDPNHAALDNGEAVAVTPLCAALLKKRTAAAARLVAAGAVGDVFTAARLGDIDALNGLLDDEPGLLDVQDPAMDFADSRPLHGAVHAYSLETAKALLDRGASPVSHVQSLIACAANAGQADLLRLLVDRGATARTLRVGRWIDDADVTRVVVDAGADVEDPPGQWIGLVCTGNHGQRDSPARMRTLIALGADPNATRRGVPALHLAARSGFLGVIGVLLDAGADVNAVDPSGRTAIEACGTRRNSSDLDATRALLRRAGGSL